jgi:hypothetical protein
MIDDDPSSADLLGQIADEFVEAVRRGQRLTLEEFARRNPSTPTKSATCSPPWC